MRQSIAIEDRIVIVSRNTISPRHNIVLCARLLKKETARIANRWRNGATIASLTVVCSIFCVNVSTRSRPANTTPGNAPTATAAWRLRLGRAIKTPNVGHGLFGHVTKQRHTQTTKPVKPQRMHGRWNIFGHIRYNICILEMSCRVPPMQQITIEPATHTTNTPHVILKIHQCTATNDMSSQGRLPSTLNFTS